MAEGHCAGPEHRSDLDSNVLMAEVKAGLAQIRVLGGVPSCFRSGDGIHIPYVINRSRHEPEIAPIQQESLPACATMLEYLREMHPLALRQLTYLLPATESIRHYQRHRPRTIHRRH